MALTFSFGLLLGVAAGILIAALMRQIAVGDDLKEPGMEEASDMIEDFADNTPPNDPVHAAGGCYCRECKYLNVVNSSGLYAHCPKTNTVFLPFELDTRTHFCSRGKPREA